MTDSQSQKVKKIICPICKRRKMVIKYGFYKDIQRYKCKNCNFVFKENKNYAIENKKENAFVQALFNMLTLEPEKVVNKYIANEKKIPFYEDLNIAPYIQDDNLDNAPKNIKIKFRHHDWRNRKRVSCENPKMILCLYKNEIRVIFLPKLPEIHFSNPYYESEYNQISIKNKPDEIITKNGETYIKQY